MNEGGGGTTTGGGGKTKGGDTQAKLDPATAATIACAQKGLQFAGGNNCACSSGTISRVTGGALASSSAECHVPGQP